MIGVVFFYEECLKNIVPLYDQLLDRVIFDSKNLGATNVMLIDNTTNNLLQNYLSSVSDSEIAIEIFNSLEEIEAKYSGTSFIYLENKKTLDNFQCQFTGISDLVHPENCIYVTGKNYTSMEDWLTLRLDKIWTTLPIESLFSDTALFLILYERGK